MYVAVVPNRNSPPAILLRESYREDGKVRNRTLKNLSDWPAWPRPPIRSRSSALSRMATPPPSSAPFANSVWTLSSILLTAASATWSWP